jgi:hypothetical protein
MPNHALRQKPPPGLLESSAIYLPAVAGAYLVESCADEGECTCYHGDGRHLRSRQEGSRQGCHRAADYEGPKADEASGDQALDYVQGLLHSERRTASLSAQLSLLTSFSPPHTPRSRLIYLTD